MVQNIEGLWQREGDLVYALTNHGFRRGQQVMVNAFSVPVQANAGFGDKREALAELIVTLLNNHLASLSEDERAKFVYLDPTWASANFAEGDYVRCNEVQTPGNGFPVVGVVYKVYAALTFAGQPMIAIEQDYKRDNPAKYLIPSSCFQKASEESYNEQFAS